MKQALIILLTLTTVFITTPAFAVNRVLSLDGDGDYVEIMDSESLNAIHSQITMEAWINVTTFSNEIMSIISKGYTGDSRSRSYALDLNNKRLPVYRSSTKMIKSPIGSISINTWHHIAGIIDSKNGVMKILLNGNEVASGDSGNNIQVSSLPVRLGWWHEKATLLSPFAGQIDEVRIWNIARTQKEIQSGSPGR